MEQRYTEIALYRKGCLELVAQAKVQHGLSQKQACRHLGLPEASISRWCRAFERGGLDALRPKYKNCGRSPEIELNDIEKRIAQTHYLKSESVTMAARKLAHDPNCREEVANVLLRKRSSKHKIPNNIREEIVMSSDVVQFHKSPKEARFTFINPSTLTYIDALGQEKKLQPGDLWERDDMSNNFLVWVPWPHGGDSCSDRYGVRIARGQLLVAIDVASQCIISYNFLIRLRDSYRADDIWDWVGRNYKDIGLPRIGERWERGTWQARKLRGDDAAVNEGHTPDQQRVGGLAGLGLRLITSQSPTTKSIERRFNFLQSAMTEIPGQIGRHRGEMERENKIWTACRDGRKDPRKYFLSISEATSQIEAAIDFVNNEPVEGTVYSGIPALSWSDALQKAPLAQIEPDQAYLFSRDRRTITASKGHVMVRYTSPEGHKSAWYFYNPELRRYEGHRFYLYFDEYQPSAGVTLVHAEGKKHGDVLGHAELVEGCPQFALNSGTYVSDPDGIKRRKRQMNAVRSEYGATNANSTRWSRSSSSDDGAGQRMTVDRGSRSPRGESAKAEEKVAKKSSRRKLSIDEIAENTDRLERDLVKTGRIDTE